MVSPGKRERKSSVKTALKHFKFPKPTKCTMFCSFLFLDIQALQCKNAHVCPQNLSLSLSLSLSLPLPPSLSLTPPRSSPPPPDAPEQ